MLPLYPAEKRAAALAKRRFVLDAFSDHLLFVRVFSVSTAPTPPLPVPHCSALWTHAPLSRGSVLVFSVFVVDCRAGWCGLSCTGLAESASGRLRQEFLPEELSLPGHARDDGGHEVRPLPCVPIVEWANERISG